MLENKSVVITGATRGVGKVTALHLASLGARVTVVGRSVERGERVAADITRSGGQAHFLRCDMSVEEEVSSLFEAVRERWGGVDGVVNNASATDLATRDRSVVEQTTEDFDYFVRSSLHSVFWSFKYGIPAMGPEGASFVTISSIGQQVAASGQPSYAAGKGGAAALSRQVAVDYADKGVRANVLMLGFVVTNASAPLLDDPTFGPAVRNATGGQPVTALDVARSICFLVSEAGRGFNGATLILDRGMTAVSPVPGMRHAD